MRTNRACLLSAATVVALGAAFSGTATAGTAAGRPEPGSSRELSPVQQRALEFGLQVAPKHTSRPTVTVGGRTVAAPNPYLTQVTDPAGVDWSYWRSWLEKQGAVREKNRLADARAGTPGTDLEVPTPFAYVEQEPAGELGFNDTHANAEPIAQFGVRRQFQAVRILGGLTVLPIPTPTLPTVEDQGSIPLATDTGIHAVRDGFRAVSTIGDGPHGRAASGSGDFDFFKVGAIAGETITANTEGTPTSMDTVLLVYDAAGQLVAGDDDSGTGLNSSLAYDVPASGDYYVAVAGYGNLPEDPFDSGSGDGAGREGPYTFTVTAGPIDRDYYNVRLDPGDVIGGTLSGGATKVEVNRVDGETMVGSEQDVSSLYPVQSPLPGGDSAFAYVAEEPGWYAVSAQHGSGSYQLLLEAYRPGMELERAGAVQRVFLDFDGERLNTAVFGGPGVTTLSPMRSFLARWGLPGSAEDAVIDATVAEVRENVRQTLRQQGLNGDVAVRVLNSRDDADPFGKRNVSRVVVGGTIAQAGVNTIGIAQSIDPGNYGHEETALVLLDSVSEPGSPTAAYSLNTYITPASDKTAFIGQALGNVISHEIGHYVGSYHVDQLDPSTNLMDRGGNYAPMYGVGPDNVGGTADDLDVDFGEDTYSPSEGFTGLEDTLNISAWGFSRGLGTP